MVKRSPKFPPSKIKRIIQQNQEVGKVSNIVPYLISRSLQLFLEDLTEKINQIIQANNLAKVVPCVLKYAIDQMPKYQFMKFAVQDLETFQTLKKTKSGNKIQKVQRKKLSKANDFQSSEAENLNISTKRGRKKIIQAKDNQNCSDQQGQSYKPK